MKQLLNTLFVMTEGSYIHLENDTVVVKIEGKKKLQVPIHHLIGLALFGNVSISPFMIHRLADDGRSLSYYTHYGKFKARITGGTTGNILLRKIQFEAYQQESMTQQIASRIVAAKIQNSRQLLLRAARETKNPNEKASFQKVGQQLADVLSQLSQLSELPSIRGIEGIAAKNYFSVFQYLIRTNRKDFPFVKRSRRPPRDAVNAVLSFLYSLLLSDCVSALEGVGLDPQMGYLHTLRPGRPALGLDLQEELRAPVADRLALALINRQQLQLKDFEIRPGGAVMLNESGRKQVVVAYQKKKQEELTHPILEKKVPIGLIPHIQARLLARYLREDIDTYLPFLIR